MKKTILICVAVFLFIGACVAMVGGDDKSKTDKTNSNDSIAVADSVSPKVTDEPQNVKSAWTYDESIDEMTDKTCYYATVVSENEVQFDFPYEGGSSLRFTLRDSPQYGRDAYIRISQGQFNASYNGTKILVRVDDNAPVTFYCNEPSDGSMDVLFLRGYDKIVKALKGAKTMKISAEFFSEGSRTFTFNVENLEWDH